MTNKRRRLWILVLWTMALVAFVRLGIDHSWCRLAKRVSSPYSALLSLSAYPAAPSERSCLRISLAFRLACSVADRPLVRGKNRHAISQGMRAHVILARSECRRCLLTRPEAGRRGPQRTNWRVAPAESYSRGQRNLRWAPPPPGSVKPPPAC